MTRRRIATGTAWAIDASAIKRDADGFYISMGPSVRPNERHGDVAVVYVHGALEHHDDGCGDSYDLLQARVREAFDGDDEWGPPRAVCLRIDSPGGAVSGLNQTVETLRRLRASSGIPLFVFVDELAASAAYALSCPADEILLPPSGICGSIGVISTMVSQARRDKADGYDFVLLTSGARKADGHVHAPISGGAQAAEQRRVDRLARQFFRLVELERPISAGKAASYEAGIFMGVEAMLADVADAVCDTWDDALETICLAIDGKSAAPSKMSGVTDNVSPSEEPMSRATLSALVKKTEAQAKAEKDPERRKALMAALEAYKGAEAAFKKTITHKETHEGDADKEGGDDGGGGDDDKGGDKGDEEEEEEEAKMAEEEEEGGNETDRKEGEEGDEEEEEAEEASEESEESAKKGAKAILAMVTKATGKRGSAAVGALTALVQKAQAHDRLQGRVAQIERARSAEQKALLIKGALDGNVRRADGRRGPAITKSDAKWLRTQKLSVVKGFLDHKNFALVPTEASLPNDAKSLRAEESPPRLGATLDDAEVDLSGFDATAVKMMRGAVQASNGLVTLAQVVADQRKSQNGKAERY